MSTADTLANNHDLLVDERERWEKVADALKHPNAYPYAVDNVETVDTHVSRIFFAGEYVYKVKKPVYFGFLDFTTRELRRKFCEREAYLNRRISPDVYLGVATINLHEGSFAFEGRGDVVEYAVKMRRLPSNCAMNHMLAEDRVTFGDVRAVAAVVADFHANAATDDRITSLGDLDAVRQNIEENFDETERFKGVTISADAFDIIAAYSRAFMDKRSEVFHRRANEGRVRDGHGDLHSANVFLNDGVHAIDCIEFNDRFRCLDVAEDVAFLAMDIDRYGRPDLSDAFISSYIERSGDEGLLELLDFYKTYRAYVRGKVTSFRLDDDTLSNADRDEVINSARVYFDLAVEYALRLMTRSPVIVVVTGLMGSGKTSIAKGLSVPIGANHISSDVTRKRLAEVDLDDHGQSEYGSGMYGDDFSRLTYDAMLDEAADHLRNGDPVVLDGTFRKREERQRVQDYAVAMDASVLFVECVASDGETERRLKRRSDGTDSTPSDGRWEMYYKQKAEWEPLDDVCTSDMLVLDTTLPLNANLSGVIEKLFDWVLSQ